MRKDIFTWISGFAGCIPAQSRIRESAGLAQSWPITTPFAIISVDLWQPGEMSDYTGRNHLMNSMCDMAQFVVSIATEFITASHLARLFMEGVLLKFGLCALIAVDVDNKFKGTFISIVDALKIRVHVAAARNHKTVGVEHFHKFLNHACKVFGKECETSECLVECGMLSAYAWNSSPIDSTEIVRNMPAIGRELKFPMDVHIAKITIVIDSTSKSVVTYLRHIQNDVQFLKN